MSEKGFRWEQQLTFIKRALTLPPEHFTWSHRSIYNGWHRAPQWVIVLCSCLCVSRRVAVDSLHFDVSLFWRFKITF